MKGWIDSNSNGARNQPTGTGKTETVKDLGRTLGLFVVVTNCTDQQKYTDCAKIFKGLCQVRACPCGAKRMHALPYPPFFLPRPLVLSSIQQHH